MCFPITDVVDQLVTRAPLRFLGVWAHPDDEAYLSAGLMHRVVASGGHVACATATRGELGIDPDGPVSPHTFARRREAELRSSLAEVGAHSLRLLGFGDGRCARVPLPTGAAAIGRLLDATNPDVVVTFGPDGVTGHPDHLAVHRWVTAAWHHHRRRQHHGELLYAVLADEFLDRHRLLHEEIGLFGDHTPVGHTADQLALTVALDDRELDRKRRALAAHASQTGPLAASVGEATYRSWWGRETFRRPTAAELADASCAVA